MLYRNFKRTRLSLALASALVFRTAVGATVTVNSPDDPIDTVGGGCTLRSAVISLNVGLPSLACPGGGAGPDTIVFDPVVFNGLTQITLDAGSGPIEIESTISINGPTTANSRLTISGNQQTGIFSIPYGGLISSGYLKLYNIDLKYGSATDGGAINVGKNSQLRLENCKLQFNTATSLGGAIYAGSGSGLFIDDATISNNTANSGGGISFEDSGAALITNLSLHGNSAVNGTGGGLKIRNTSGIALSRSTISSNQANRGGGIDVYNSSAALLSSTISNNRLVPGPDSQLGGGLSLRSTSSVFLSNSTISSNTGESGGGIFTFENSEIVLFASTISSNSGVSGIGLELGTNGTAVLANTIIANSRDMYTGADERDCLATYGSASIVSYGGNFIEDNSTAYTSHWCRYLPNSSGDPRLGPLAPNGGPTLTHALLNGSPAINSGVSFNTFFGATCSAADQRGELRNDGQCDMGAFEFKGEACFVIPMKQKDAILFCL